MTGYFLNGSISIPNVTGDVVITCSAVLDISSISAVFNQGSHVVNATDSLDSLKPYLTVTATYLSGNVAILSDSEYELSGTLSEGTSIITASYADKTDTFTVNVAEAGVVYANDGDIVLDGNTVIDTEYVISTNFTIMVSWSAFQYVNNACLFSAYNSNAGNNNPAVGIRWGWGSNVEPIMSSMNFGVQTTDFVGDAMVITRTTGYNKPVFYYKNSSGELVTNNSGNNWLNPVSNLFIGAKVTSDDGTTFDNYATATITTFKVYNIVCSTEKIKAFLGVE